MRTGTTRFQISRTVDQPCRCGSSRRNLTVNGDVRASHYPDRDGGVDVHTRTEDVHTYLVCPMCGHTDMNGYLDSA